MKNKVFLWLHSVYLKDGKFTGALLGDVLLLIGLYLAFKSLLSHDRSPTDGFFDSTLTLVTIIIAALVMVVYHLLWHILETPQGGHQKLVGERWPEQIPRFLAALCLLFGLSKIADDLTLFVSSLVMFYFLLVIWQLLLSAEMRKIRGTLVFDCFGFMCATAFAFVAYDLYQQSQEYWQTLPNYATDPLSADVVKRAFGGKQVNRIYTMGLFAGAMAANAILAFAHGLVKSR
jgi:hypothetical protein